MRSELRQGVQTIYGIDIRRMKQIDHQAQERVKFSLDTYETEAAAWSAFEREGMGFGGWLPAGTEAP